MEVVAPDGESTPIAPRGLRVVSHAEAAHSGLTSQRVLLGFGSGADGSQLIERVLDQAKARNARLVSDISINLVSTGEGGTTECRTAVVPESVTETRQIPGRFRTVPVQQPVTRTVTEQQYRCHTTSRLETRMVTEHQQRCHQVSHPVTRTRTTYSTQYDSFSKSSRSVPHTQSYTETEYRQECRSEPVQRMRTQSVPHNDCHFEPVTHTVTRYEFQLASQYVPPRTEVYQRHRLRELEPVCIALDAPSPAPTSPADPDAAAGPETATALPEADAPAPKSRIEALFYFEP